MAGKKAKTANPLVTFIFIVLFLAVGLLCGTQSTLTLRRDDAGAVTAANQWRLNGTIPLITRTVTHLRDAKMARVPMTLQERRETNSRDVFGMVQQREELLLIGDKQISYPFQEDLSLIRSFLANPAKKEVVSYNPIDIRRQVVSWFFLGLACACIVGWLVTLVLGRDPLASSPGRIKPLPPAVGATVFLGTIGVFIAFFSFGHTLFGPLATAKVNLLRASATGDDAAGIEQALQAGVFVDVRDDQGATPLLLAVRAGATKATEKLLQARANANLSNISGDSPLMLAVSSKRNEIAARLLDVGADIHDVDANGRTPLYLAAAQGNAAMVRRLIKEGASVNQTDAHGWTPLITATGSGDPATVIALLDAGADPRHSLPDGRRAGDLAGDNVELQQLLAVPAPLF